MGKEKEPSNSQSVVEEDKLKDNPFEELDLPALKQHVKTLYAKHFEGKHIVTENELQVGARLARNYGYHDPPKDLESQGSNDRRRGSLASSLVSDQSLLEPHEWSAIKVQQSKIFWDEPKDLLVTMVACCIASMAQGWDQVANGNLGWPQEFGLTVTAQQTGRGRDIWIFGIVNAIMWFGAAICGPFLVDPVCYSSFFGRRGSVFIAAAFGLGGSIWGGRAKSWEEFLGSRLLVGVGIGAKASIVPIWESEILPPAKRGRLLVSWQFFNAMGIFAGSCATYICHNNWRNQVLTSAIPALLLLLSTYLGCESPRWLITRQKYEKAFHTLVKLRKERVLAAEEFCYIYFQVQTERALFHREKVDLDIYQRPIGYSERLPKLVTIARNRRAAIASWIVMVAQQLSGINTLAFLASTFFVLSDLGFNSDNHADKDGLRFSMGWSAGLTIFSIIAFFLIEPLPVDPEVNPVAPHKNRQTFKRRLLKALYGRRALLLVSLIGGTVSLLCVALLLRLDNENPHKVGVVIVFIMFFTLFYAPGAGAVPFIYTAEVWPNEGREVGMSWGVFWNFVGSGILALFVPRGFKWGASRLFGVFTGTSAIGAILVYFFVPSTDHAISLEEMSKKFNSSLVGYGFKKLKQLVPIKIQRRPSTNESASTPTEAEHLPMPQALPHRMPEIQSVTEPTFPREVYG
ncbi:MFS general substrate transporter [Lophium mytilinum]|uniref:MFS general substrate transporter n=1 Tax=Lophium mytilinum TaxID=390894 RepID=A0A6A6QEA5_9PEZI|nr:MFS general substrate transporter [Lophium mytilinum]